MHPTLTISGHFIFGVLVLLIFFVAALWLKSNSDGAPSGPALTHALFSASPYLEASRLSASPLIAFAMCLSAHASSSHTQHSSATHSIVMTDFHTSPCSQLAHTSPYTRQLQRCLLSKRSPVQPPQRGQLRKKSVQKTSRRPRPAQMQGGACSLQTQCIWINMDMRFAEVVICKWSVCSHSPYVSVTISLFLCLLIFGVLSRSATLIAAL